MPVSHHYQRIGPLIVGRARERELLHDLLGPDERGGGKFVLISGEAGIGKTTLVANFIQKARQRDWLVLSGGCYDLTTTPPYGPWTEALDSYPSNEGLPLLPDWVGKSGNGLGVTSQTALFEGTKQFFQTVADHQSLALVLEDLHWSDPASLELLRYLGRACADNAILFVVTYRHDELTRQHPLFQLLPLIARETDALRIELQPLTTSEIRDLLVYEGLSEEDTVRLVTYLKERASGNPLFTTELLRALETEGTLEVNAERVRLGELDEEYLPALVLQVIERSLAHLAHDARRALEIAAVVGQDVRLQVWEAVSGFGEDVLDTTIEQAFATHILSESSERNVLSFTHALVREVLYTGIIPTRRRRLHCLVAEAFIATADPDPDAVAFHLNRAGDPRLIDWLVRAGERAEQHQAPLMAAERFDQAQSMMRNSPDRAAERALLLFRTGLLLRHSDLVRSVKLLEEAESLASASDRPVIAHLALAHRGLVHIFLNEVRQGLDEMRAGILALESLDAINNDEFNRLMASPSTGLGVQGRGTLGLQLTNAGYFGEAKALLEDRPDHEWENYPDAVRATGQIYVAMGQPDQARRAFTRSQNMYETLNDPGQAGQDAFELLYRVHISYAADNVQERHALTHAAATLWASDTAVSMPEGPEQHAQTVWALEYFLSGEWDLADELLDLRHHHSNFLKSSQFDPLRLQLARHRGDITSGWQTIRSYLPEGPATEPGTRRYFLFAEFQPLAVEMSLEAGRVEQARAWLEANDQLLEWSGAMLGRAENRLLWARYHLLESDLIAARRDAARALEHASDPRQPLALLTGHRFLGTLDTRIGRYTEADEHFKAALDLAAACEAPFERALTLLELARLRIAQKQLDDAQGLLDNVRAICEPLKAQPTLDRVGALEAGLQEPIPAPVPFGLTLRELEVLELVAEGLTDPQVAERLFVSPRTVSSHLASIYNKLGVSSRAAATRIAVEQGIL